MKFSGVTILHGVEFFHFPIDFSMDLTKVQRYCAACDFRFKEIPKHVHCSRVLLNGS